jgi:hypothetical protein
MIITSPPNPAETMTRQRLRVSVAIFKQFDSMQSIYRASAASQVMRVVRCLLFDAKEVRYSQNR